MPLHVTTELIKLNRIQLNPKYVLVEKAKK